MFVAVVATSLAARAQGDHAWKANSHSVSAQYGVGWFGLVNGVDVTYEEDDGQAYDVNFDGGPATTVAYDYRVGRTFSIGGAYGFQASTFSDFREASGGEEVAGEARLARHFVSARALFHYGRARDVEFYSGVRAGLTLWRITATGGIDADQVTSSTRPAATPSSRTSRSSRLASRATSGRRSSSGPRRCSARPTWSPGSSACGSEATHRLLGRYHFAATGRSADARPGWPSSSGETGYFSSSDMRSAISTHANPLA